MSAVTPLPVRARSLDEVLYAAVTQAVTDALADVTRDDGQCLTVDQVAERLCIDRKTVYRLMGDGELPWCQVRSKRVVKLTDLLAYQAGVRR